MVVKIKESFEKTRHIKNNDKSKKYILRGQRNTRYYEKILSNKKNLINSILLLIQYNCTLSRLVVYKKAYDISRKGSHRRLTPTTQQNHSITNPRV